MKQVIYETGTITQDGKVIGQLQIIESTDGQKRVQMYNTEGVFLCECGFEGETDYGFAIGLGMQIAYQAAWRNANAFYTETVNEALRRRALTAL